MKLPSLSCQEARMVDQIAMTEFAVPSVILMENAGRNATRILLDQGCTGPVLIACGKGNNGGDGFVMARHLDNREIPVEIFLTANPKELRGDAKINFEIVRESGISVQRLDPENHFQNFKSALAKCDWVVDALLGTGVSGGIKGIYKTVIEEINQSKSKVLSVDIPSGMDCDTGNTLGTCIKANCTVTFVARKKGFDNPESKIHTGIVHVADIGVPRVVLNKIIEN
jgi:NAD(P)H-hydrate epimerase